MYKYKSIKVNGVKHDEHRYLMEQHLGRRLLRNEVVHHLNEDKRDNRIENLTVMSLAEHGRLHQTGVCRGKKPESQIIHGERVGTSKLTNQEVREIKLLISKGESMLRIARAYGVVRSTIHRIRIGETWSRVTADPR